VSSSADHTDTRPARWPWIGLATFLVFAAVGTVLTHANDESIAAQVPYIVAFTMFGVVGALIVSRDPRNVIGLMLLYGALMTSASFLGGELATFLIDRGHTGPDVVVLALLNNFGWLFGILPIVFILPLVFPDGHLPSRRFRWIAWLTVTALVAATASGERWATCSRNRVAATNGSSPCTLTTIVSSGHAQARATAATRSVPDGNAGSVITAMFFPGERGSLTAAAMRVSSVATMLMTFASWSTLADTLPRSESTVSPCRPFFAAAASSSRVVSRTRTVARSRWVDWASDDGSDCGV